MSEIAEAAFNYQIALEKGEKKIVGVNTHPSPLPTTWRSCGSPTRSRSSRCGCSPNAVPAATMRPSRSAVAHMVEVSPHGRQHDPEHARGRPGGGDAREICDALRAEWGEYREPARF